MSLLRLLHFKLNLLLVSLLSLTVRLHPRPLLLVVDVLLLVVIVLLLGWSKLSPLLILWRLLSLLLLLLMSLRPHHPLPEIFVLLPPRTASLLVVKRKEGGLVVGS